MNDPSQPCIHLGAPAGQLPLQPATPGGRVPGVLALYSCARGGVCLPRSRMDGQASCLDCARREEGPCLR